MLGTTGLGIIRSSAGVPLNCGLILSNQWGPPHFLSETTMTHSSCKNLFQAGKALLEKSRLVVYNGQCFECSGDYDELEEWWKQNLDPRFGRYMAWVWFSVGAENLMKAALSCNELIGGIPQHLGYPIYGKTLSRSDWIDKVLNPEPEAYGSSEAQKYDFGTLGQLCRSKLPELCEKHGIPTGQSKELKAAYSYLTAAIRNRDGHTYIENRRKQDFPAVGGIFVPAFNTLVKTMTTNKHPF